MRAACGSRPPARPLAGDVTVPGDKSIAHRALLLGALADGTTTVTGLLGRRRRARDARRDRSARRDAASATGDDGARRRARASRSARGRDVAHRLRQLGHDDAPRRGPGRAAARRTSCSTATPRCGAGRWSASPSRCGRWARASRRRTGTPPVTRARAAALAGVDWTLPVAERAGEVGDPARRAARARHDARARAAARAATTPSACSRTSACAVARAGGAIAVAGGQRLRAARRRRCPGDPSSAAFLVVAALLVPGSTLARARRRARTRRAPAPSRSSAAWAPTIARRATGARAPASRAATCVVRAAPLRGDDDRARRGAGARSTSCRSSASPPRCAEGETRITGAAELRVKESDRLAALEQLARARRRRSRRRADGLVDPRARRAAACAGGAHRRRRRSPHRDGVRRRRARAPTAGSRSPTRSASTVSFPGFFERARARSARRVEAA